MHYNEGVAVAELSKALAWPSGVCLCEKEARVLSLGPYSRRTLALADSANYMSIGVVNGQPPSFGGGEGKVAT